MFQKKNMSGGVHPGRKALFLRNHKLNTLPLGD